MDGHTRQPIRCRTEPQKPAKFLLNMEILHPREIRGSKMFFVRSNKNSKCLGILHNYMINKLAINPTAGVQVVFVDRLTLMIAAPPTVGDLDRSLETGRHQKEKLFCSWICDSGTEKPVKAGTVDDSLFLRYKTFIKT